MELFIRNGRSIELTNNGKVIYEYCTEMFKSVEGITKFLNHKEGINQQSLLRVAVSDEVERPFVADIIGKLIKRYKKDLLPKITMVTDTHEKLIDQFKLGNVDLVVTHKKATLASSTNTLIDLHVALIGQPKFLHKEGRHFKNIGSLLKSYESGFVMPADKFKLRSEIDIFLAKEKYRPRISFESDILAANIRALQEGVGIGFLPIAYVKKEIKKGLLASYSPAFGCWKHQLYIVTKTNVEKNSAIDEFKRLFLEEAVMA